MFTPEGELREEYRFLESEAEDPGIETAEEARNVERGSTPSPAPVPGAQPPDAPVPRASVPEGPIVPETEEEESGPGILDLVGMLAEPIPYYLGEAPMPNGVVRQDLQMARIHIDLLDVLRRKTAGNLTAEESSVLEDILYQLRMRYVQKQG